MCGRYTLKSNPEELAEAFDVELDEIDLQPRYNIAPSQTVPVVRESAAGRRELATVSWGLIPFWAKDQKTAYKMINARSETVLEKPAYRDAFKKRRCLVPASGFYEWKKIDGQKQPYHFGMKDDSIFAFAGIWDQWKSPEGKTVESCSILTTSPNELLADVHDRMPVILSKSNYALWLTAEAERASKLTDLLVPFDSNQMKRFPVSTQVNSPKNQGPECTKEISI